MKARSLIMSTVLVLMVSAAAHADIGFRQLGSVGTAGLAPLTAQPQFADDDIHGTLVLLRNNNAWVIVKGSDGTIVASDILATASGRHHTLLLADITADGSVDLVIAATTSSTGTVGERRVNITVDLLEGPDFDGATELLAYSGAGGLVPLELRAVDGTFDGNDDLVVALPEGSAALFGECLIESMQGHTYCFGGSNADQLWNLPAFYSSLLPAVTTFNQWYFAAALTAEIVSCNDVTGSVKVTHETVTMRGDRSLVEPYGPCPPPNGVGEYTGGAPFGSYCLVQNGTPGTTLDLATVTGCEYGAGFERSLCDPMVLGESAMTLTLQRMQDVDATTPVWSRQLAALDGALAYHSMWPQHLLVWQADSIMALSLDDGAIMQIEKDLPDNAWPAWTGPHDDPWLVATSNDAVTWYALDQVTSIGDDDNPSTIPQSFTLEQPYPNPFNAQLSVPLETSRRMNLTVAVYDVLGRVVTILREGQFDPGEHTLTWDASRQASGVYFVRVSHGGSSREAKVVLLK